MTSCLFMDCKALLCWIDEWTRSTLNVSLAHKVSNSLYLPDYDLLIWAAVTTGEFQSLPCRGGATNIQCLKHPAINFNPLPCSEGSDVYPLWEIYQISIHAPLQWATLKWGRRFLRIVSSNPLPCELRGGDVSIIRGPVVGIHVSIHAPLRWQSSAILLLLLFAISIHSPAGATQPRSIDSTAMEFQSAPLRERHHLQSYRLTFLFHPLPPEATYPNHATGVFYVSSTPAAGAT